MEKKKTELLFDMAEANDGYVSVAEARQNGLAQTYLSLAEEAGLFLRVCKGLYRKKGSPEDPFYELSFRYRKAVFSFRSALYLHGLTDQQALEVHLPQNYLTQGIEGIPCRHVGAKEYGLGQALAVTPLGNLVPTYDLERTLIELLRRQKEFSKEEFLFLWKKGLRKKPYEEKLFFYADKFHIVGELELALRFLAQ